jgi:hypothetical protein
MNSDTVMMGIVLVGISLSLSYFYVAVALWRQFAQRELEKSAVQMKLHAERVVAPAMNAAGEAALVDAPSPCTPGSASDEQIAA